MTELSDQFTLETNDTFSDILTRYPTSTDINKAIYEDDLELSVDPEVLAVLQAQEGHKSSFWDNNLTLTRTGDQDISDWMSDYFLSMCKNRPYNTSYL